MFAIAPRIVFGLFGNNDPGFRNFHQHDAICLRGGARQPAALNRVIAKFFCVRFIVVFGINFHFAIRIAIDSFVPVKKSDRVRKFPFKFVLLAEPIPSHVNGIRVSLGLNFTSVCKITIRRTRQSQMLAQSCAFIIAPE